MSGTPQQDEAHSREIRQRKDDESRPAGFPFHTLLERETGIYYWCSKANQDAARMEFIGDRPGCPCGEPLSTGMLDGLIAFAVPAPAGSETVRTLRHIEAVRNHVNVCIAELMRRGEEHDQSKLEDPERSIYEDTAPQLRQIPYGGEEYRKLTKRLGPALQHHYANNAHHPEHFAGGIRDMTLIDLLEMVCDWRASGLRRSDGNIYTSVEVCRHKYGISDELASILTRTLEWLITQNVYHKAEES